VLVLVADGMGGREGGETASGLASRHVSKAYYENGGAADESLLAAFHKANDAIFEESQKDTRLSGMGTTCTAVAVVNGLAFAAHVGDSRIYLVRGGEAYRMTEDHSAPMQLVNRGIITLAEAAYHEDRNVILRALGTRAKIEVAQWKEPFPLLPGDRLVLCSDGLHGTVSDGEIARLSATGDVAAACAALIDLATRRECGDNVTAAVLYLGKAEQA
jgi:protein phosphatase